MSEEIKNMMTSVLSGETQSAQTEFNSILSTKLADRIEAERVNVSNAIFNGVEGSEDADV